MLYEINKTTEIFVDTAIGNSERIKVKKVVKQGSICFATTATVNEVGKKFIINIGR